MRVPETQPSLFLSRTFPFTSMQLCLSSVISPKFLSVLPLHIPLRYTVIIFLADSPSTMEILLLVVGVILTKINPIFKDRRLSLCFC